MVDYATFQKKWDKAVGEDSAREFGQWKESEGFSRWLQRLRIQSQRTEEEMAKILGWTKKDVLVFEMEESHNIYFGDLLAYLHAIGLKLDLRVSDENAQVQDQIAYHVSKIYDLFKGLSEKAGDDRNITISAVKFIHEYHQLVAHMAVNISSMFENQKAVMEAWTEIVPDEFKSSEKGGKTTILDYEEKEKELLHG